MGRSRFHCRVAVALALVADDGSARLPPAADEDRGFVLHMMQFDGAMIRLLVWKPYFFCAYEGKP